MVSSRLSISLLLLFCTNLFTIVGFAQSDQTATVKGTIKDEQGLGLPYVILRIGTGYVVTTDNEGKYIFKNIPFGEYEIIIESIGYGMTTEHISVNKTTFVFDHQLKESVIALKTVEIITERIKSEEEKVEEQPFAVESQELELMKGETKDVNQVLNQMTGIRVRQSAGMGSNFVLSLNGLSGKQIRYFLDGIPIDQLGAIYQLNNMSVNLVERIDVYKGVVPVELGADALGGGINIITNNMYENYLDASYSYGSFNTHRASLSGQVREKSSGLTVGFSSYFNYSDNNYEMKDMPVFENFQQKDKDIKRFHDAYSSQMGRVNIGFTKKKWADELKAGFSIGEVKNEVQSPVHMSTVALGQMNEEEQNKNVDLRYRKTGLWDGKLNVDVFSLFSKIDYVAVDTSAKKYDWAGNSFYSGSPDRGEISYPKSIYEYNQRLFLNRFYTSYRINQHQNLNLNYVSTNLKRQGENILLTTDEQEALKKPNSISQNVLGLEHQGNWMNKKLMTIASVKYYNYNIHTRDAFTELGGKVNILDLSTVLNEFGYAFALRYFILKDFQIKTSFEKGYRIPQAQEIFGDGIQIIANPYLRPESSNNLNLGLSYRFKINKHIMTLGGNLFYRNASDFIFLQNVTKYAQYQNVLKVLTRGLETNFNYKYGKKLMLVSNFTYQDVLNNEKYVDGTQTASSVYRDQMPNTPYFFANTECRYYLNPDKGKIKFSTAYTINYVEEFFLNYSSVSQLKKNVIPSQFVQNWNVSLSDSLNRWTLTMEVSNLFNELAYDNYRMQRPGRAYSVKLRYFLHKI